MTEETARHGDGNGAVGGGGGDDGHSGGRIGTQEAARRLGVKPETLYAYVSRGLLDSRRAAGGRGSTFDPGQVAALARRGNKAGAAGGPAAAAPAGTGAGTRAGTEAGSGVGAGAGTAGDAFRVRTAITLIEPDRFSFRGVDATELAAACSFEEIAAWLWSGTMRRSVRFEAPREQLAAARAAAASLPAGCGPMDRLRVAVIAAAAADPLRFDLAPEAVLGTARGLIPTMVDALPPAGEADPGGGPLPARLWSRLTTEPPDPAWLRVLDTALGLLVDHDLAASTLAARVAASARAHPYAVVSAGLGALDGPLHGQTSALAHRMLAEVLERGGAAPVVAAYLRAGQPIPGLGHRLYRGEDPRARMLLDLLARAPGAAPALEAARDLVATAARHAPLYANVDLALAVLSLSRAMPAEAGETVFAVARTVGWIAHALEEYDERPLRMRPSGAYEGPRPGRPLPAPAPGPGSEPASRSGEA
ncbi:citrate/2-methylcitrate synthase [Streptomyces sp. V4-01]|uniref:citrate synthase (unknown stereospecificity) n=1 Tax=Actinacidiphila polyblastidii TaxID=3110430 RepID=A0ABU7P941_9ACTN|nr:citrate/2-methylcitrate synthase [Streptomyces sp. V4-01]